jgi:chemotaxis response regulator CheB
MPPAQMLIVEDKRIIAADLTRRITRLGHAVVAMAGSRAETMEWARVLCPDLVPMDTGLPCEMGLEASARI